MHSVILILILITQSGSEQFFEKVTPGLGGNLISEAGPFLNKKDVCLSLQVISCPFQLYPYTKRAWVPSGAVHLTVGLNNSLNIHTGIGLYIKNRTRTPEPFYGVGLRFNLLRYDFLKNILLDISFHRLKRLHFFNQDPNFTAQYKTLNHIVTKLGIETTGAGLIINFGLGVQYFMISGRHWQEAEPDYRIEEYSANKFYPVGTLSIIRRFTYFGLGLNIFMSRDIPGFSLEFLFKK